MQRLAVEERTTFSEQLGSVIMVHNDKFHLMTVRYLISSQAVNTVPALSKSKWSEY